MTGEAPQTFAQIASRYSRRFETRIAEQIYREHEAARWWLPDMGRNWGYTETLTMDGDFGRIIIPSRRRNLIVPHASYETRMTVNSDGRNTFEARYPDGAELNLRIWPDTIYGLYVGGVRNSHYVSQPDYRFILGELQAGRGERIMMREPVDFRRMMTRGELTEYEPPRTTAYEPTAYELPSAARQDSHFLILRQI